MKPLRTRTVHGWEEISRLQIAIFSIVETPAMPPSNDGRSRDRVRKQTLPQSTGTNRGGFHPGDEDLSQGTPGGMAVNPPRCCGSHEL